MADAAHRRISLTLSDFRYLDGGMVLCVRKTGRVGAEVKAEVVWAAADEVEAEMLQWHWRAGETRSHVW